MLTPLANKPMATAAALAAKPIPGMANIISSNAVPAFSAASPSTPAPLVPLYMADPSSPAVLLKVETNCFLALSMAVV